MAMNYTDRARPVLLGLHDESTRQQALEEIVLPTHLPLFFTFAKKGDNVPTLALGTGATFKYGDDTFDEAGIFATHQTPYINKAFEVGNPVMLQRITPDNAKTSMVRLSVEVIKANLPIYARNQDGSIKYQFNAYEERIPVISDTRPGYRLVFHVGVAPWKGISTASGVDASTYGNATVIQQYRQGTYVPASGTTTPLGIDSETSTLYPIKDILVSSDGKFGDNIGFRIQLPSALSGTPLNLTDVYNNKTYIPRFGVVRRDSSTGSYTPVTSNTGSIVIDCAYKETATTSSGTKLGFQKRFLKAYATDDTTGVGQVPGDFDDLHVYADNVKAITSLLVASESAYNNDRTAFGSAALSNDNPYMVNFLGGFDENGAPYFSFETANSALYDGISLGADTIIYASGGDDGILYDDHGNYQRELNYDMFDKAVRAIANNFDNGTIRYDNYARYPFSAIWDSGFTVDTKKALLNILNIRKDVGVVLSTFSAIGYKTVLNAATNTTTSVPYMVDRLSLDDELSIGAILQSYAALHPESEAYGTSVRRVMIFMYSCSILNSNYDGRVPLNYDYLGKVCKFMGSSVWDAEEAYDLTGNNIIDSVTDISGTWMPDTPANAAWARGLVYPEDYDIKRQFHAAYRTVCDNPTSVTDSSITMWAICYAERVAHETWRKLVGNSKWGNLTFLQESNRMIKAALTNVFDRFEFEANTYFTQADVNNGYSWSTEIIIYAAGMKRVGTYTVTSRRLEDYKAAA